MKITSDQKKSIGTVFGLALFGFAIWYLAFKGKEKIKIKMPSLKKKPKNPGLSSGSGTSSTSGNGGTGYKPNGGGSGSGSNYNPTPKTSTGDFPIQPGSRGAAVIWLQEALNDAGFNAGTQDGVWGPKTTAAYKQAFPGTSTYVRSADWEYLMKALFPNNYQAYL
ncbi:hypothetical protein BKI52_33125 [marine bacterium AO1-C]|nr:hypothetical protein BKI52_33125 [marine bacterium AO1-C]